MKVKRRGPTVLAGVLGAVLGAGCLGAPKPLVVPPGTPTTPSGERAPARTRPGKEVCRDVPPGEQVPEDELPPLEVPGVPYETPRAGQGFRTEVFGRKVAVQPRDRRTVTGWDVGMATVAPGVTETEVLPFASAFIWRRPDLDTFFRGIVAVLFNEIQFSKSTPELRPFEGVLTLESLTVPFDQSFYVDGVRMDEEELTTGKVYPGIGVGYRRQLEEPGYNDNMFSVALVGEPGYRYFDDGKDTAATFVVPQDTIEDRGRVEVRLDAMERNLLELPHKGYALGGEGIYAYRTNWEDWGNGGSEDAGDGRDYLTFQGYVVGAGGVPFVDSSRHRLVGSLHGGTGADLDRFSALRVGGGPSPTGEEYGSLKRPIVPGAFIDEFETRNYAILLGEYRWEPIFFTYLSLRSSFSYVERLRSRNGGEELSDDFLGSIGARITTGFFFNTRLQLDYNYNAGVLRQGDFGGHEVVVHVGGQF